MKDPRLRRAPMQRGRQRALLVVCVVSCALATVSRPLEAGEPFAIHVVDEKTGRGVPLVELETTNNIRFYTDSNGIVAFDEPGLLGSEVFFHVRSHGYEFREGFLGFRGKTLRPTPGGRVRLELRRINVAERLYRVTGAGIYRDSHLVGDAAPVREPLLNARVTGSDSVNTVVFGNKIYWFWGDTNRPRFPLGNFHVPGATSELPERGGLEPSVGVDLRYFPAADGFAKATARLLGEGTTWVSGVVVLKDPASGKERMFAHYVKTRQPIDVYERGLVEFDDSEKSFRLVAKFARETPFPHGAHAFVHDVNGTAYVYYADPFPLVRVPANPEALARQESYESFSCLKEGTRLDEADYDRDSEGNLRFGWKTDTEAVFPKAESEAVKKEQISSSDRLTGLRDIETGKAVVAHRGSVYWNNYRRRWVMIAGELFGSSVLGETWYAEAEQPLGPWVYARKIVTHEKYSFYNPKQHPMLDEAGGRLIYFEGTYSTTFSGNPEKTPRYDYNQILYRLDLDDTRLNLPVPVYEGTATTDVFVLGHVPKSPPRRIAFFALDRPAPGTVTVYSVSTATGVRELRRTADSQEKLPQGARPLFYALPPDRAESEPERELEPEPEPEPDTVPLHEFLSADRARRGYSVEEQPATLAGFERAPDPLVRVWRNPLRPLPVSRSAQ